MSRSDEYRTADTEPVECVKRLFFSPPFFYLTFLNPLAFLDDILSRSPPFKVDLSGAFVIIPLEDFPPIRLMKYILLLSSMALSVGGQILLKRGVLASSLAPNLSSVINTVFTPLVFSGLLLYGLSAIIWLFVLQRFPLSVAYPAFSLTYVAVVILGPFLLGEPITAFKVAGMVLIVSGVFFLFR